MVHVRVLPRRHLDQGGGMEHTTVTTPDTESAVQLFVTFCFLNFFYILTQSFWPEPLLTL